MANTGGMSWFSNPIGFEDNIQITDPTTEIAIGSHSTVIGQEITIQGVFASSIVLATRSQAGAPFGCAFSTILGQDLTIPQVFYSFVVGSNITTSLGLTNSVVISCLSGSVGTSNLDVVAVGNVLSLGDSSQTSVLVGSRLDVDAQSPNTIVIGDNDVGGGKMVGLQSPRNVVIGHFETGSIGDYCSDNIAIGTKSTIDDECTNSLALLGATIGDHSGYCLASGAASTLAGSSSATAIYGPYNICGQNYGTTVLGNNLRTGDGVVNTVALGVGTGGVVQVGNSAESIVAVGVLVPGAVGSSCTDVINVGNGNTVGQSSFVGLVQGYLNQVELNNRDFLVVGRENHLVMNGILNLICGGHDLLDSGSSSCVLVGHYLTVGSSSGGCVAVGSAYPAGTGPGSSMGAGCLHSIMVGNACTIAAAVTGGIAIGHGPTVNGDNSIALGSATSSDNECIIGSPIGPPADPTDLSFHTFIVYGWDLTTETGASLFTIKAIDNPASGETGLTCVYSPDGTTYSNKTIKAAASIPVGALYLYVE